MDVTHPPRRVLITGAAGAGSTTLGRVVATQLAIPHHDSDDYLWLPTAPPYRELRPKEDRLRLMREMFLARSEWVLSGGVQGWADEVATMFDLIVFLRAPTDLRLTRLRAREARTFGVNAVAPGGWREKEFEEFIDWASRYDDGTAEGRNLPRQLAWLKTLRAPVLRLDGSRQISELTGEILDALPTR